MTKGVLISFTCPSMPKMVRVSSAMPSTSKLENFKNMGIMVVWGGTMMVNSTRPNSRLRPRNLYRAKP